MTSNNSGDMAIAWVHVDGSYVASLLTNEGYYSHSSADEDPSTELRISELGQVTGNHRHSDGRVYGFRSTFNFADLAEQEFVLIPGFVSPTKEIYVSDAKSINDAGVVVGSALYKAAKGSQLVGPARAFSYTPATGLKDLGVLGSSASSSAENINNQNQIVGISGADSFLWTPASGILNLDSLVEDAYWNSATAIVAKHINEASTASQFGQIAGYAAFRNTDGTTTWQPFMLTPIAP